MRQVVPLLLAGISLLASPLAAAQAPAVHPVARKVVARERETIPESDVRLYLTIVTGRMIHKPGWPAFIPADIVVPAHTLVTVVIRNLDDGTAPLLKGDLAYTKVTGTAGNVAEINEKLLVHAIPNPRISHTFTVPKLHLNVPIPPSATVEFTFRTPGPGTYVWQCMAPCGTGPNGMGGPMVTNGYMTGTLVVR